MYTKSRCIGRASYRWHMGPAVSWLAVYDRARRRRRYDDVAVGKQLQ